MENQFSLTLDGQCRSIDAIRRAMHDLSSLASFNLSQRGTNFIISAHGQLSISHDELRQALLDTILDHEVRLQLEQEFATIRQVIVEQAVNPLTGEALSRKITLLSSES